MRDVVTVSEHSMMKMVSVAFALAPGLYTFKPPLYLTHPLSAWHAGAGPTQPHL